MLNFREQGVKGGRLTQFKKVGFVEFNPDYGDNRIMADDFEGQGNSYKQRDQTRIIIRQGNVDYFEVTFTELLAKLSK